MLARRTRRMMMRIRWIRHSTGGLALVALVLEDCTIRFAINKMVAWSSRALAAMISPQRLKDWQSSTAPLYLLLRDVLLLSGQVEIFQQRTSFLLQKPPFIPCRDRQCHASPSSPSRCHNAQSLFFPHHLEFKTLKYPTNLLSHPSHRTGISS